MSAEVICLSSDEDETRSAKTHEVDKKAHKRKSQSLDLSAAKKQKIENSPRPGCSKEFNTSNEKKRKVVKPQLVVKSKIPIGNEDIFSKFQEVCLARRNDVDTKKVLYKVEKLYNKLNVFHKEDREFKFFIEKCHEKITRGLSNDIYTPILELNNEIKRRIKINSILNATDNGDKEEIFKDIKVAKKDMERIQLLERSIEQCLAKIKELENKEVDFDVDEDSAYIKEDKYKRRLIRLCHELSKINGDKTMRKQIMKKKIRRKDITDSMTGISSVDEAVINFINSDIGKINQLKYLETHRFADHIKMPEYLDILKCIEKCVINSNLDLSKEEMARLAKRAFQAVGYFLKKKRMEETKFYIQSLLDDGNEDPAQKDIKLNEKLQKNKKEGDRKLEEIFEKYVDKQKNMSQEDMQNQDQVNSDDDSDESDSGSKKSETNLSSKKLDSNVSNFIDNDTQEITKEKQANFEKDTEISKKSETNLSSKKLDSNVSNFIDNNTQEITKKKHANLEKDAEISKKLETNLSSKKLDSNVSNFIDNNTQEITKKKHANLEKYAEISKKLETNLSSKKLDSNVSNFINNNTQEITKKKHANLENDAEISKKLATNLSSEKLDSNVSNFIDNNTQEITKEKHVNFEKDAEIIVDEDGDGDILVINGNDDSSDSIQDPLDINKVPEAECNKTSQITKDVKAVETCATSTPTKAASDNVLIQKPGNTAKADDSNKVFIKVCAFAKPPSAWGDTSPEKVKKKLNLPIQHECIDLTEEKEKRVPTTSTRSINPLANIKCTAPAKRVVIVKNVINNYNLPLPADGVEKSMRSSSSSNITIVRNRRSNDDGNIARTPWLSKGEVLSKDKRPYK